MSENKPTKFCRRCGTEIPRDSKFCKICGAKLIQVESLTVEENKDTSASTQVPLVKAVGPMKGMTENEFCQECGGKIVLSSVCCPYCGTAHHCRHCGSPVGAQANYCPNCSVPLRTTGPQLSRPMSQTTSQKNEGIAAILSFLWLGLGQIYVGKVGRGIALAILGLILIGAALTIDGLGLFLILLFSPLWAWNIYDAYSKAKEYDSKLAQTGKPPW